MKKVLLVLGTIAGILTLALLFAFLFREIDKQLEVTANYEFVKSKNAYLEDELYESEEKRFELELENNELTEKLEQNNKTEELVENVENARERLEKAKAERDEMREKGKNQILDILKSQYEHNQKLAKTLNTMSPEEQEAYLLEAYQKRVAEIEADYADDKNQ